MASLTEPVPTAFEEIEHLYCGSVYPNTKTVMADCEDALCLFSAEWYGRQDAYWLARAGLKGTCVDLNLEKLSAMCDVYPEGWTFVTSDVFEFAENAYADHRTWDVVTLDPWTGQFDRCAKLIDLWCALARKVVVLGHGNYRLTEPEAPEGWAMSEKIRRSDFKGGINWLVFTRA